ncbi:hypothetical protein FKM82_006532 [Ascaphus truei]
MALPQFEDERRLIELLSVCMVLMGAVAYAMLQFIQVPYGRYSSPLFGPAVPVRWAWFIQELPSLVVPIYFMLHQPEHGAATGVLMGAFILHYLHRTLIYPLLIRGGKPTPLASFSLAFLFCCYNGYLQSSYLCNHAAFTPSWTRDPRFITGGLFEYVSGANFFGEILQWSGFAIAGWSLPGAAFAIFTALVLTSRAQQHHQWYLEKFEDYPKSRKIILPFLY